MLKDPFSRALLLLALVCGIELSMIVIIRNDAALRLFGMRAVFAFLILIGVFVNSSIARYVGGALLAISALVTLITSMLSTRTPEPLIGIFVLLGPVLSLLSAYYLLISRTFSHSFATRKVEERPKIRWARTIYWAICGLVILYLTVLDLMSLLAPTN